ncbi:MAG: phosphoglycolate phosphatase [Pseudomonadales bacterium]|nr:phosphoglycolate phosphatase [Pseudomonadales bacterium]
MGKPASGTQAFSAVFFDLDGTLVDSVPDLAYAIDQMLQTLSLPVAGVEKVRHWVGNGAEKLIERALFFALDDNAAVAASFVSAKPLFYEAYQASNGTFSVCYPGVLPTLLRLRENGFRLSCITNKPVRFTHPLLRQLELEPLFEKVVSGDTLSVKKPHPAPLLFCAEQLGVAPSACLMVGDSRSDVLAAKNAGVPVVAVSYGYNHGEDIRNEGADHVIDRFDRLPAILLENRAIN